MTTRRDLLQAQHNQRSPGLCLQAQGGRHWHTGTVVAVNGSSVDVALDGASVASPTTGLPFSALYSPRAVDNVVVDHETATSTWLVTHPV